MSRIARRVETVVTALCAGAALGTVTVILIAWWLG